MPEIAVPQPLAQNSQLREAYRQGFKRGLREGIWLYAFWKDGIQYVGSCGHTLAQAYEDANETYK
jgi:hypothetical protein